MKKFFLNNYGLLAISYYLLPGCIPFVIQPPGPREYQVQASKEISTESVKALAEAQREKVVAMKEVAVPMAQSKVEAIKIVATEASKNTKDPEALTNINANAVAGIVRVGLEDRVLREIGAVDGTAKAIGGIASEGIGSMETSTVQYGMYAAAQGAIGMQAYPQAIEQMKGVTKWAFNDILPWALGITFGGGGLGYGIKRLFFSKKQGKLLRADGTTIDNVSQGKSWDGKKPLENFSDKHKQALKILKGELAKAHASIPVDAKKEHGIA